MIKRKYTVKRKVGNLPSDYRQWNTWKEDDWVIGKFIKTGIDTFDKINYVLEVEEASFNVKNKYLTLNSCGSLDVSMKEVEIGEVIQVTYLGTDTITKGKFKGKDAHRVSVDILGEEGESEEEEYSDEDLEL